MTRFSFWSTDQGTSRTCPLVIGWRVRERSHLVGHLMLMVLTVMFGYWSVCQQLYHASSIQLRCSVRAFNNIKHSVL